MRSMVFVKPNEVSFDVNYSSNAYRILRVLAFSIRAEPLSIISTIPEFFNLKVLVKWGEQ